MKKSIFGKYIVSFAAIIFVMFILLTATITATLTRYAEKQTENNLDALTSLIQLDFEEDFSELVGTPSTFRNFVLNNKESIQAKIDRFSNFMNDKVLLIFDEDGKVILIKREFQNCTYDLDATLDSSILSSIQEGKTTFVRNTLGGIITQGHISTFKVLYDDSEQLIGYIAMSSTAAQSKLLLRNLNQTILMACIWIMLAALIACYFISERITSPLRMMTSTAKEYAKGHMESRIVVKGNDEVGELGDAFNTMADSLEETEKMRNSFLANVSHDLRTPMTTIAGFVDNILNGTISPDKEHEYLEIVSSEAHRLSRLITEILDLSKLESGERKFTSKPFDACEIARIALISFEQKIEEKKLEVEFQTDEDSMIAYGDSDAIHQVFYNLIENAIKFSKEGGALKLSLSKLNSDSIEVTIFNEGQGIPENELPYVFDRFYKTDKSRSMDKTGVGLGLYIVKTILSQMNESISVDSKEGEFCEFKFTIALQKNA